MRTVCLLSLFVFASAYGSTYPCQQSAQTEQFASLMDMQGDYMESWKAEPGIVKALSPPNGFALGVRIDPVSDEVYRMRLKTADAVVERVEVVWFDLGDEEPQRLRSIWGGSNSL
jgi:hypothetical protein